MDTLELIREELIRLRDEAQRRADEADLWDDDFAWAASRVLALTDAVEVVERLTDPRRELAEEQERLERLGQ